MSNNKNNAPTPPKKNVRISDHILKITKEFTEDKKVQSDAVNAFLQMRPKSYAEVFHQLFTGSKRTLFVFHLLSSILCFPLIFSLVWQYVLRNDKASLKPLIDAVFADVSNVTSLPFLLCLFIAVAIVGLLEYWQHIALQSSCKIHFQDSHSLGIGLILITLSFSIVSVVTSGYGAVEVVQVQQVVDPAKVANLDIQIADAMRSRKATNSKSTELLISKDKELEYLRAQKDALFTANKEDTKKYSYILILISALVEIMIVYTTISVFVYMFRSMLSVQIHNDLGKNIDMLGLGFSGSVTPTQTNQTPAAPHRAQSQNNSTGITPVLIQPNKPKNPVQTKEQPQKQSKKTKAIKQKYFTRGELQSYYKTYSSRAKNRATPKARRDNQIKADYITFALSTFDQKQDKGKAHFDLDDAAKWHTGNSQIGEG